ncbi:hypothetical protein OSB04_027365 [Centaurea solstitialis]|uniref:Uncharacterized protein n=1 Tax=Centaurea solstitialis TaxID=347529 RepID=A0AA38W872_9ASTR|nr:hypothetical protein OSB04_027365 [Centaurea solstitialis]
MIKASFRGGYDADHSDASATVVVNTGGGINLRASTTGDTFVNGPSLNGVTLSLENPGFFNVDYNVQKKDVRFQFMNTVCVNEKPLHLTYTHSLADDRTALDGTLFLDSSHKVSANYGVESGNCKVKYSYAHGGVMTIEPCYDFAENSWDLAVSRRIYDGSVVRGSYNSSTRVLGVDWKMNSFTSGNIKVTSEFENKFLYF